MPPAVGDFGDLRHIGVEALVDGDAAGASLGHRPAPVRNLRDTLQHADMAGLSAEQREASLDRILAACREQFVEKASRS